MHLSIQTLAELYSVEILEETIQIIINLLKFPFAIPELEYQKKINQKYLIDFSRLMIHQKEILEAQELV